MQNGNDTAAVGELTPEANRAARGILRWSLRDLACQAGIAFMTVHRFEKTGVASETTKRKIITALSSAGVEIIDGGARLRRAPSRAGEARADRPQG